MTDIVKLHIITIGEWELKDTIYNKILNLIYPAKCGFCGEVTGTDSFICPSCRYLTNQEYVGRCQFCGKISNREICMECNCKKIYYEKLVFCNEYTEEMKNKIHAYKFLGKKYYYNFFSELLFDKLYDIKSDIIIPVPISKERYKERGYNQSAIIAKKLAKCLKMEYNDGILIKIKHNERQSMQNFKERQESVKNVFKVADNIDVSERRVILIDDVFTTGATINECSRILKDANVKEVIAAVISISHTLK